MNGPERADLSGAARSHAGAKGFAVAPLLAALVLLGVNPHAVAAFACR